MKSSVAVAALMMLTACGAEGVQLEGVVEHEGVQVRYETYWKRPDVTEKLNQEQTLTGRISINGKTVALNPGTDYPKEWAASSNKSFLEYGQDFWRQVAEKFAAQPVPKDRQEDHRMIVRMFEGLQGKPAT